MIEEFGRTADGTSVGRLHIEGGGLSASLLTWGCVVQDLRLAGHDAPLVLGFAEFAHYPAHSPYFGATAGRYANRIRDGRFEIDGESFQTDRNFLGKHLLHGGVQGVGKRVWKVEEKGADFAAFSLDDPDGAMGFPGNCRLSVRFDLPGDGQLRVRMEGVCDRPTLVNLAHHSYFNLDSGPHGSGDILDHELSIDAQTYLPVDDELIPTGEERQVAGTAFDFRALRPIRHLEGGEQTIYDHNFCLSRQRVALRAVASARSRRSGVSMQVLTSEPGVQFYAGHKLATPVPGLGDKPYGPWAGFCLEPQVWPDSPHHPAFPQAVLRPGETYRQETVYRFVKG
jgi:aldose 1-epimerase